MLNLAYLIALPFLGAAALFLTPARFAKWGAFAISLLPLGMLLYGNSAWIGQEINVPWVPMLHLYFHLSVDPLSFIFLLLTALIIPIAIMGSEEDPSSSYFCMILWVEAFLIGFFTSQDLVLFVLFWEAMLLPLYFMILRWGKHERYLTSLKFIIYMVLGSFLLIAAVLALHGAVLSSQGVASFDIKTLASAIPNLTSPGLVFFIFFLAFAVKTPLFPFHGWLPDTYTFAPLSGSILLSALLSKAGIYGFIRIGYGLFPEQLQASSGWLLSLALIGVLYGALTAWSQTDFKRVVAYSSLSHVNFILAGIFALSPLSIEGAVLQSVNHGITVTALFLAVSWIAKRISSTSYLSGGGLANVFPHLTWVSLIFMLSAVALPGTGSFVGEFMILVGLYGHSRLFTACFAVTVILTAIYMLYWMQTLFFGKTSSDINTDKDLTLKEWALSLPLLALIGVIGLYPAILLDSLKPWLHR